ncbi:MAG: radical SAM protein [Candidatus Aenigmarchaeota archaeon]|nr:radical SAM protein [Candidatus Aenigmarchaeota archaeon]
MIDLAPKILEYKLKRRLNWPRVLPMNITISVSYKCNSRCRTCNVWRKISEELVLKEWDEVFRSLGRTPFWFTVSGGEPFLRKDLVEIVKSIYKNCRPGVINIPTNGLLYNQIPQKVKEIVKNCPKSQIIVNLSIDGIREKHDAIRGIPGNFDKAMRTYRALKKLKYPNFTLGIHTVISKFNVDKIPKIYQYLIKLKPDSYVTEIAEERVELGTDGLDITPSQEKYSKAIDFLIKELKKRKFKDISKITQSFRTEYYQNVKRILRDKSQVIPCYAGIASAQIAPNGDVWSCCIRVDVLGNLKENDFDFKKIWFSKRADEIRKDIKSKKCYCPMANVSYTNMLCDLRTLTRLTSKIIKGDK